MGEVLCPRGGGESVRFFQGFSYVDDAVGGNVSVFCARHRSRNPRLRYLPRTWNGIFLDSKRSAQWLREMPWWYPRMRWDRTSMVWRDMGQMSCRPKTDSHGRPLGWFVTIRVCVNRLGVEQNQTAGRGENLASPLLVRVVLGQHHPIRLGLGHGRYVLRVGPGHTDESGVKLVAGQNVENCLDGKTVVFGTLVLVEPRGGALLFAEKQANPVKGRHQVRRLVNRRERMAGTRVEAHVPVAVAVAKAVKHHRALVPHHDCVVRGRFRVFPVEARDT